MGSLGRQGDRLKEYREKHLDMTIDEVAEHYDISGSTWSYSETDGKTISQKILDALSKKAPPPGRARPNMSWLLSGEGKMTGLIDLTAASLGGDEQANAIDHGREAARIVLTALRNQGLEGELDRQTEDWLIDQFADGLATGRSHAALVARLDFLLQGIQAIRRGTKPK